MNRPSRFGFRLFAGGGFGSKFAYLKARIRLIADSGPAFLCPGARTIASIRVSRLQLHQQAAGACRTRGSFDRVGWWLGPLGKLNQEIVSEVLHQSICRLVWRCGADSHQGGMASASFGNLSELTVVENTNLFIGLRSIHRSSAYIN